MRLSGYELEQGFQDLIFSSIDNIVSYSNECVDKRIEKHLSFVKDRMENGKDFKHTNKYYNFPVITKQETELILNKLISFKQYDNNQIEVAYSDNPKDEFCINVNNSSNALGNKLPLQKNNENVQLTLFAQQLKVKG